MTGGGQRCWQQWQHVIWEWTTSRGLRLSPDLWSEIASDETISWKQSRLHGLNNGQVQRLTQRMTKPYMIPTFVRGAEGEEGWRRVLLVWSSSFYRRLPHINAGLPPLACAGWPCRLCCSSRAIIGHHVCGGHQCQGQSLDLPGLASHVYICGWNMYGVLPAWTWIAELGVREKN